MLGGLWNNTENWVRTKYNPYFKISDKYNDCIKHMIITSVKDVTYQKRKSGNIMCEIFFIEKSPHNEIP